MKKEPDGEIGGMIGRLFGQLCNEYDERVVVECFLDATAWVECEISDQPNNKYRELSERLMSVLGDFRMEVVEESN